MPSRIFLLLNTGRVLFLDSVKQRWHDKYGKHPTEKDVEEIFEKFIPLQLDVLPYNSDCISGLLFLFFRTFFFQAFLLLNKEMIFFKKIFIKHFFNVTYYLQT